MGSSSHRDRDRNLIRRLLLSLGLPALIAGAAPALALPSFAQQTGLPCSMCHTAAFGPALTPFGQNFKLEGYAAGDRDTKYLPLAVMQLSSFTHTGAAQEGGAAPGFKSNDSVAADQTSIFFASRIGAHMGAFVQATNDGVAHTTAWDNLDLRYADRAQFGSHDLLWGMSLNNNPTVQDVWNSTPAWSIPCVGSPLAPAPMAAPLLEGALAQEVGGLTAYGMLDGTVYLEAGAYRTLSARTQKNLGVDPSGETTLNGAAPYWRAALQYSGGMHYASLGTFGMAARLNPGGDSSTGTDSVRDFGYDATYQYDNGNEHRIAANLTWLQERGNLDASVALGNAASVDNHLDTLRFNLTWIYCQTWALGAGPFVIRGNSDATLYAPGAISGSAGGSPNSRGFFEQVEYIPFGKMESPHRPWLNLRLGAQYVSYTQFNGGGFNYDGSGRSARDNDTLYLFMWWAM